MLQLVTLLPHVGGADWLFQPLAALLLQLWPLGVDSVGNKLCVWYTVILFNVLYLFVTVRKYCETIKGKCLWG